MLAGHCLGPEDPAWCRTGQTYKRRGRAEACNKYAEPQRQVCLLAGLLQRYRSHGRTPILKHATMKQRVSMDVLRIP